MARPGREGQDVTNIQRYGLWAALVCFLAVPLLGTAKAQEVRLPYDTGWAIIPGNQGINWFLGKWIPNNAQTRNAVGHIVIHPDGRIVSGNDYPESANYKVIGTSENLVLLFVRTHFFGKFDDNVIGYEFAFLRRYTVMPDWLEIYEEQLPPPPDTMFYYNCGAFFVPKRDKKRHPADLGEEHWQMSVEQLREVWDRYEPCNPNFPSAQASHKYPLGQSWGNMSPYTRATD